MKKGFKRKSTTETQSSEDSKNRKKHEKEEEETPEQGETSNQEILESNVLDGDDIKEYELQENDFDGEQLSLDDPFTLHLNYELNSFLYKVVSEKPMKTKTETTAWPCLGNITFSQPQVEILEETKQALLSTQVYSKVRPLPQLDDQFSFEKLFIKQQILGHVKKATEKFFEKQELSKLQQELLTIAANYQDIYFPERNLTNGEEVRFVYCIHAINHVLKTRLKVIHHNAKLSKKSDVPEEFRDQGLVRPKVLILLPFKDSALRVVKMMMSILLGEDGNVMNKKRFMDNYKTAELIMPKKNPKPPDYELMFSGNIDDSFKIGISITKKCLKLYADFYSSDIILASPLGLRMLIGAEGEKNRDFDFLSSIEVLIIDQAQVLVMQNWEHVLHIMDHMHLQPKESHGTDLARVRMWSLNGWSKYYRQNLIFSSPPVPEITALFNKKCSNYAGKVIVVNPVVSGTISKVILQLPQVFHQVIASSVVQSIDARFDMFTKKILPNFMDSAMKHTVIYIPSYFDYVKIRNYFKRYDISFVQICEYSKDAKIARARDMFFHSQVNFLLYSERFHFFRRIRLRGIHNIIFYQPPAIPFFYSEMCNVMQDMKKISKNEGQHEMSVTVLYSKYDAVQLASIVGSERAMRMLASDKPVHMFMTDN